MLEIISPGMLPTKIKDSNLKPKVTPISAF